MLSSEEQMQIIKGAISEGYKGPIFKLIDQANVEKGQTASTEQQQEQGLRGSDGNTSMAFPNSEDEFNTKGMDFDLDIRKYDKEGNLVKSYQKVPPGIKSLNMGEEEGTVIETPSQYKDGGFEKQFNTNYQESQNYQRIKNSRKGSRYNPPPEENALTDEGSYSTHLMADDKKNTAWPTLFQNKDGSWFELSKIDAYKEAKRRDEIYKFDSKKELIDFSRKGNWKDTYQTGGYRRKQYQDAGFIGPQLPPDYVAPETKSEPVVEEKPVTTKKIIKKKKPIRKKVKPVVNDNSGTRFTPRPDSVKDVKKLQNLLVSEGFDVGKHGADGAWGEDTAKAYDKYIARTDAKEVSWLDRLKGVNSKLNNQGFSQAVQTYAQYTGNALLQGYGLVGEDETYFDVTEDDLRQDELGAYKSMLRDNFNKGRGSKIDYRGYSNDPEIANASSSEAARELLEARGISSTILNDFNPFSGTNKTKEALHTLTGNANYTIDKDGNVYVQDNYDFNYSQNKKGLKAGTTFSELYKHATADKYEGRGYDNAHSVGDQVKSRIPVNINLGQATDLGLTPSEISQLGKYNPNASGVSTVSSYELLKRGAKKLFGYQRGGFYQEGGKKNVNREKPRGMMLSSPVHTFPTNREYLKTEIDEIVSLEKESDRPKTKKLLEVTNFMENSMGDDKEAYGRTYTNSQASIDEIMLNDLFDKKKDKDGNEVNHSKTQLRYFEKLKRAGLPTNKAKFKEELENDNPKAAINAMRMVYGKVPESIPEVTDTLGMFNYYNDNYRKNNKIKDLTESKKRFYDGYGRTFKKGGYITRKRKKKYL